MPVDCLSFKDLFKRNLISQIEYPTTNYTSTKALKYKRVEVPKPNEKEITFTYSITPNKNLKAHICEPHPPSGGYVV